MEMPDAILSGIQTGLSHAAGHDMVSYYNINSRYNTMHARYFKYLFIPGMLLFKPLRYHVELLAKIFDKL